MKITTKNAINSPVLLAFCRPLLPAVLLRKPTTVGFYRVEGGSQTSSKLSNFLSRLFMQGFSLSVRTRVQGVVSTLGNASCNLSGHKIVWEVAR